MTSPQTLQSTYRLSSGHEIPILGYGVDSAIMYRNEKACGRAIAKSGLDRSQIFFTTKIPPGSMGYERTKRAVESSLREAGVEYFDLILIHAPYGGKEDRLGSWKALVEAQKAGKTKSIGVSNYGIHHLDELEEYIQQGGGGTINVGQYEIHPWCAREDIVEWLQKRNIVVEAYSPLAHGTRMGETVLKELGKKYNKSPAQIMIRWCLQRSASHSTATMKLILSTSNLMTSGGHTVIRQASTEKSNVELINSLRSNFQTAQQLSSAETTTTPRYRAWTRETEDGLYIPAIDFAQRGLAEEKAQYDITVKLFYLPGIPASRRCAHTREAIDLVLKELHVDSIDLLIVSFPGILFDAEDDSEEEVESDTGSEEPDDFDSMIRTWRVLEDLQEKGMISQLGVAEFGSERLARFLPHTKVKPSVDQINLKDCCVVPKSLILYAKSENIQLLTHNDCMDILPIGTTRELLGPGEKGAGILASAPDADDGIQGDVEPQWVVKYTAVVKDRGVVENKGYFALADMGACVKARAE
ncbi:NADP-dependent oxidoreductase domain-containing protein [Aspergillus novoparasiticus]|uniref:D-xylose reductase [NAD(P)H] n=1 Tax=Aspergillus novoparasiticus TaxID=986946 RepID=A0A5N6EGV0_9EURO|nr:NADP-dependent oxidoreductase domain-containing protein [Aspergillus novoparasiticus]